MANPNSQPDRLLSRLSLARRNAASGFVANFGAPSISVPKTSGLYRTWPQGSFLKNEFIEIGQAIFD